MTGRYESKSVISLDSAALDRPRYSFAHIAAEATLGAAGASSMGKAHAINGLDALFGGTPGHD